VQITDDAAMIERVSAANEFSSGLIRSSPSGKADRAFVFDLGGVVLRWRPEDVLRKSLPHRCVDGIEARRWAAEIFQSPAGEWLNFDRGMVEIPELAAQLASRTGLSEAEVHAVIMACPSELQPVPAVIDWIKRLQARSRTVFFLSNMSDPFATGVESAEYFKSLFKSGIFSGRVKVVKPDAAIFELAARTFGYEPENLLLIDDHQPNIVAARVAGWQAIRFIRPEDAEAEVSMLDW
jgi:putative hydrolase of the HAD superfamily